MRHWAIPFLFLIGVCALTIRMLLDSQFGHGTLLYLLVPFVISIAIYLFTRRSERRGLGWALLNHLRFATIIFLATSALLFEGFICVLMFMPIYYVLVTAGYVFMWLFQKKPEDPADIMRVCAIPALVLVLSAEGLIPATTIARYGTATYTTVADQTNAQLQANMAAPITFAADRPWFLSLFPLPDRIEAGTLGIGDVHRLHFTYKKWFFTNYQRGEMDLRIAEVSPRHIRTEIIRNTAYLSHYMKVDGTDVYFEPLTDGRTRISLTVKYYRLLDPAWYFGPMQNLAAKQSARYLVDTIIIRNPKGLAHEQ